MNDEPKMKISGDVEELDEMASEHERNARACWREWRGVCRVWPQESDRAALAEIN